MKIMHTMASEANASRPQRRFYSPELKGQVTQQCRQSGASVAGVALSHGINANIVHRWLREHSQTALVVQSQAFVPVTLDEPAPGSAPQAAPDIRVPSAMTSRVKAVLVGRSKYSLIASRARKVPGVKKSH